MLNTHNMQMVLGKGREEKGVEEAMMERKGEERK